MRYGALKGAKLFIKKKTQTDCWFEKKTSIFILHAKLCQHPINVISSNEYVFSGYQLLMENYLIYRIILYNNA